MASNEAAMLRSRLREVEEGLESMRRVADGQAAEARLLRARLAAKDAALRAVLFQLSLLPDSLRADPAAARVLTSIERECEAALDGTTPPA